MGDRILSVNNVDIRNASHHDAVQALLEKKDRMKLRVQHDPLPPGFKEVRIEKKPEEKLSMVIKGGLQGQPGNPLDPADEGVFISKVNEYNFRVPLEKSTTLPLLLLKDYVPPRSKRAMIS